MKRHATDKPWITSDIKTLIKDRQKACNHNNILLWRSLKCKVQFERAKQKKIFYKDKINHLKSSDTRKWWKMVNRISGKPTKTQSFCLERDGKSLDGENLASVLNEFYVSVNSDIPPLVKESLPAFLPSRNDILTIQSYEVCYKLMAI